MNNIIVALEIIGTIAFSISGALIAISYSLDIFGVIFLGVITAVGGGMLRDVLLGIYPPTVFSNSYMFSVAALSAVVVFVIAFSNTTHFNRIKEKIERINNIFDAIGLSAFSVTGVDVALSAGFSDKILFVILMGMITGVGGGIFRDILVSKTPYVLKKHIYAIASLSGSLTYYVIRIYIGEEVAGTIIAMLVVFFIRILSTRYRWKLPKIKVCSDTLQS